MLPAPPYCSGKRQGEQAQLLEQREHVVRILGRAVDVVGARGDPFARDAPDEVLDLLLVVVQCVLAVVHG